MSSKKEEERSKDINTENVVVYSSPGGGVGGSPSLDALFDYYEKKFQKQDDKIENQKLTIIETLGIFVALFTFISIDFQVFRSYRNPYAVGGLSILLLGAISFLLVVFDFYILQARAIKNDLASRYKNVGFFSSLKERYENNPMGVVGRIVLFVCSLVFIVGGLILFCNSSIEKLEDEKNEIKKEVLNSVRIDLNSQKSELEKTNNDNKIIIEETNESVADFKRCVRSFGFTYKCFEEK